MLNIKLINKLLKHVTEFLITNENEHFNTFQQSYTFLEQLNLFLISDNHWVSYIVKFSHTVIRLAQIIQCNWLFNRILHIIHNSLRTVLYLSSNWQHTFRNILQYFSSIWLQHASINCERREHRSGSKRLFWIDCEIRNTFPLRMHLRSGRVVFSCTILELYTVVSDDMRYFSEHALPLRMRAPRCPLGKWNAQPMRATSKPTANDLTQVADAYVGQFGATFGTTRSRTALQIQIQIRRYTDQAYTRSCGVFGASFSSSSSELANFVRDYLHFFILLFGICFCFGFAPFRLAAWLSQRRSCCLFLLQN